MDVGETNQWKEESQDQVQEPETNLFSHSGVTALQYTARSLSQIPTGS